MPRWLAVLGIVAIQIVCAPAPRSLASTFGDPSVLTVAESGTSSSAPSATQLQQYLSNGSVEISWYEDGEMLYQLDCGFFAAGGGFEGFSFETEPDGVYYYDSGADADGSWFANDGRLCLSITYTYDSQTWRTDACYAAEWSVEDSLLLIDGNDKIAAEVFAFDGRQHYADGCGL